MAARVTTYAVPQSLARLLVGFVPRMLLPLVVIAAASCPCGAQETPFAPTAAWTGPSEGSTSSVALGDVDGDGDLDLVRGNVFQSTTLYLNTGGTFAPTPTWKGPPEFTQGVALGDVDGDGDLDLVRGNYDQASTLYLNTGGTFASSPAWTGWLDGTLSVALGDVNGDGHLDLVCGNLHQAATLYLNTRRGTFTPSPAAWIGSVTQAAIVALGDMDADGDLDLVHSNNGSAMLYLNTGGTFGSAWTGPVEDTRDVALGDVDGDGNLDLVRGNYDHATLYLNTGGTLGDSAAWTGPTGGPVTLGDVNGDGHLDLACGGENLNQGAALYLNTGGTFGSSSAWTGPAEGTRDVALGDVDGDGDLDLLRGNNGSATLYPNTGGTFAPSSAWTGPEEKTYSVALGDVDGDGALDLVRGNLNQGATLYLNTGGTFAPSSTWTGPAEATYSVALGDVDGDGDLDLVRGNYNQDATLYLNTGSTFGSSAAWTGPTEITLGVALGDVDGDGDLDLVRGNAVGGNLPGATLYLNTGGTLGDSAAWTGPAEGTRDVALGDVDGDGDLDLVRANDDKGATLYLNTGGLFASAPAWTRPLDPVALTRSVALGDVDGDSDLDLVCGNYGGEAWLYLNTGGTFDSSRAWAGPQEGTTSVALGDVDGDGDLDLVRGNSSGTTLYLNTGGTFAHIRSWTEPARDTESIALGDVDGDGDLDLVCGKNRTSTFTALYLNRSPWHTGVAPASHLPNNAAHVRWARLTAHAESNHYRISFHAFDAESDPLWLVGEYQREGAPAWDPMILDGSPLRAGPFSTSPTGLASEAVWDVAQLPFDRRNVVIRLRAVSNPQRVGVVQFVPSYLANAGPVVPDRPGMTASPGSLAFDTITVGDSAVATLRVANVGTRDLTIDRIDSPDPAVVAEIGTGLVIPPGGAQLVSVLFAPRALPVAPGPLRIHSNDPTQPVVDIPLALDARPLAFSTALPSPAPELPLGGAATVVVIPAPLVRIESGFVFYRPPGSVDFGDSVPLEASGSSLAAIIPGRHVTEAGLEYYVRVENSGIYATDPPHAPDSIFFKPVAPPTGITTAAQADPGGRYPEKRATPIVVTLPVGVESVTGALYFRAGGAAAYDSLPLAPIDIVPGTVLPGAFVPADSVGARGLEYWVRVQTLTRSLTDPPTSPAQSPRTLRTDVTNVQEAGSHAGSRYHIVSIPLELSLPVNATLEVILSDQPEFGTYDPVRWRSYRWLPTSSAYAEIPEAAGGALKPEPGRAFWLIAKSEHRIDTAPSTGRSIPTDAPYRVRLERGWNQVGNPFLFPVAWSALSAEGAAGPVTLQPPVAWDEAQGAYRADDVTVLAPFEGYWVWNSTPDPVDLVIPPDEIVASAPGLAVREGGADSTAWQIQIAASCEGGRDPFNMAGVAAGAEDGLDALDRAEPPAVPGTALSLYFVGADGIRRTSDLLPRLGEAAEPAASGRRWSFDVTWTGPEGASPEVRLAFSGLDRVPADVQLWLRDRTLERMIDLRRQASHSFFGARQGLVSSPAEARFELIAGGAAYVEAVRSGLAEAPRLTRLLPSFPNPVVSHAVIRFEIAQAGPVRLALYDVAGRKVKTLVDEMREPGRYELSWAGGDDRGTSLPAGVYALRLSAPDRRDVRKLLKIR